MVSAAFTGDSSSKDTIAQKSIFGILVRKKALHFLQVYAKRGFIVLQFLQVKKLLKLESNLK